MFGLCRRESDALLGMSTFGCFSTRCYRAHDDVHQLQTDRSVWCSCLQICLWFPAKQSLGFRDLWCTVLHELSATYHHIIRAALPNWIDCYNESHMQTLGACVCAILCVFLQKQAFTVLDLLYLCYAICIYQCVCSSCKHGSNKSVNTSKNNSVCHKICITTRLKLPWISSIHSLTFILLFFSPSSHAYRNNRGKNSHATQLGCAIFVALPNDSVCFITCYFECSYTHR